MRHATAAALLLLAAGALPLGARAQSGVVHDDAAPRATRDYDPDPQRDPYSDDRGRDDRYAQDRYGEQRIGVRVWLDDERDLFRPGEMARVLVRPSQDAYVAVLHIDPDGDVEVLWPRDYYEDGFMRGGQTYAVSGRAGGGYFRVGTGYGLGYVMAVASDEPLDTRRLRDYYYRRNVSWDPDLNVYGDPFHAMESFARMLVPDYDQGYGALDWYSYSVGSTRYRFPRYACYDAYGAWYTSRSPYYDSCDRVRLLLVEVPYYYDTRYYHGDRARYWGRWYASDYGNYYGRGYGYRNYGYGYERRDQPQHGYKENGYPYDRANGSYGRRQTSPSADAPRSGGRDGQEGGGEVQRPTRERPTLQRRPPSTDPVTVTPSYTPPSRRVDPEPRTREVTREPPQRSEPRETPRSEPRSAPPPRSEPRSSPPPRDAGSSSSGRSAPSESPRVRPPPQG